MAARRSRKDGLSAIAFWCTEPGQRCKREKEWGRGSVESLTYRSSCRRFWHSDMVTSVASPAQSWVAFQDWSGDASTRGRGERGGSRLASAGQARILERRKFSARRVFVAKFRYERGAENARMEEFGNRMGGSFWKGTLVETGTSRKDVTAAR